jgi:16S rRNA (cytosine1402-N4)-methyltransferase
VSEELIHKPVLLAEVLEALQPHTGGRYIDATLGGGSHARAILEASSPDGFLYGCDRDAEAIRYAQEQLAPYSGRFELRQMNFSELDTWISPASCDGALMDLGISSLQLDKAERGFSFQQDGELDMRVNREEATTAADLVNQLSEAELTKIFQEYGQERESRRFARAIVKARQVRPFVTTRQLAELIERLHPRRGQRRHPATQMYQALRIAVNNEWKSLESGLAAAWSRLSRGGRLVTISFNSGEERIVKAWGREKSRDYTFDGEIDDPLLRRPAVPELKWVHRKAIHPTDAEVAQNPRARSAQLRVMEKL